MRIISDIFAYTSQKMPKYNSISISGYHMREAGATADLELAYTLADGVEYVRAGIAAGMGVDKFAPRLSFFWAIGMNYFMEVAKMRAARLLWAKLVKQFDPKSDKSLSLRTHSQTSGWSLTAQDVYNNAIRTCFEAMAAGRRTDAVPAHQFVRRSAGAADGLLGSHLTATPRSSCSRKPACAATVDPWGGSYYVERLTYDLARKAWEYDPGSRRHGRHVQGHRGGPAQAAHRGSRSQDAGAHRQRRADHCRRQQVPAQRARGRAGPEGGQPPRSASCSSTSSPACGATGTRQLWRRHSTPSPRPLETNTGNLLELGVAAARAKATVGEISYAIEKVVGRHQAVIKSIQGVYAQGMTARSDKVATARALADDFERSEGRRPRILIAKMGQDGHDRGQKVVASGFADLGWDVDIGPLFQTPAEAARQAVENDVHVVAASSLAAGHLTLVPELRGALDSAGPWRHHGGGRRRCAPAGL